MLLAMCDQLQSLLLPRNVKSCAFLRRKTTKLQTGPGHNFFFLFNAAFIFDLFLRFYHLCLCIHCMHQFHITNFVFLSTCYEGYFVFVSLFSLSNNIFFLLIMCLKHPVRAVTDSVSVLISFLYFEFKVLVPSFFSFFLFYN